MGYAATDLLLCTCVLAGWRDNVRIDLASWLAVSNPGHSTLPSVIVTGLAWQPNITTDHQRLLISCLHHGVRQVDLLLLFA